MTPDEERARVRQKIQRVLDSYPEPMYGVADDITDLVIPWLAQARREENEACAKMVEGCDRDAKRFHIADAIRARQTPLGPKEQG